MKKVLLIAGLVFGLASQSVFAEKSLIEKYGEPDWFDKKNGMTFPSTICLNWLDAGNNPVSEEDYEIVRQCEKEANTNINFYTNEEYKKILEFLQKRYTTKPIPNCFLMDNCKRQKVADNLYIYLYSHPEDSRFDDEFKEFVYSKKIAKHVIFKEDCEIARKYFPKDIKWYKKVLKNTSNVYCDEEVRKILGKDYSI